MNSFDRLAICFLLCFAGTCGYSQDLLYRCKVKQVLSLSNQGTLVTSPKSYQINVGQEFVVDRNTGEIKGESISTRYARSFGIVDKGGREGLNNHFKVSGVIEHWHPTVFFLEIQDMLNKSLVDSGNAEYPFAGYFKYWFIAGMCK